MSEEGTDPISFSTFSYFFDKDKRLVKEHEFRQAVFRSKLSIKNSKIKLYLIFFTEGIDNKIRNCVWKFLFQFYAFNSTPRFFHFKL